jgi:excisionase family DNA binding protein
MNEHEGGTNANPPKLGWSVEELASSLGLSKSFLRNEIRKGSLRARKIGRRVIILTSDLDKYLSDIPNHCEEDAADVDDEG